MKAWTIARFGEDGLELTESPDPVAGPGEVLLAPRAVALNFRDHLMRMGAYNPRQPLPLVPCSDAVADVVAVGPEVDVAWLGRRVLPAFSVTWTDGRMSADALTGTLGGPRPGTLAERVVVPVDALVPAPAHLSDVEAATLPCAAVTAWRALRAGGPLGPGSTVLTLGTGGVSTFALDLAVAMGARVAVTSSSDERLAWASGRGAAFTVNYMTNPKWGTAVRGFAPDGVDVVVEVGGAGTLDESLAAVAAGGTVSLVGVLGGASGEIALRKIFMRNVRVQGIFVGSVQDLRDLCGFLDAHPKVRPYVDRVFSFDAGPDAFAHLAARRHVGKVVVRVG